MSSQTENLTLLQSKLKNETWSPLAYSGLALAMAGRAAKYTGYYLARKTPAKMPYTTGFNTALLFPVIECCSIRQSRVVMKTSLDIMARMAGLGPEAQKKWAVPVEGNGWKGFWIPFQDQVNSVKDSHGATTMVPPESVPVGSGCDIVLLYIHGGGFIDGNPLMFLEFFLKTMKATQQTHNLKIGILAIDYSLSPEHTYPVASDEIIASYKSLIQEHSVHSKKIVLIGDSAGGNICLGTTLRLRDQFPELGRPGGQIGVSPWVCSPEPLEDSLYDFVSKEGCEVYWEAYTKNKPELQESPYTRPYFAETLSGLAPTLIYVGGQEILRSSIENFVKKAKVEDVDITMVFGEDRPHNYCLLDEISTEKDRQVARHAMGDFLVKIHDTYKQHQH
ncbi:hypothetical protein EMPS_01427 [Entomortierella parvispora]|uniref:Alpha/beta hydrolase fold-3 domain-containing protein n=1 Tax=Entomortierella parvispora TaxID=205924 RepID=A0A9P3H2U4_9FUNG|nr:hypothetical protein EMPS_01427 [Entomortierella parvispora]